jgi:3-hydroxyacyl-[acyl-carrier-protein] dehydratase
MTTTEKKSLDILQIKRLLPHRYPLLLVDRVLDWESGKSITAIKNVSVNEEFFQGHFPHKPVMPGVLMIEALAQTAALLSFLTMGVQPDENSVVYFVGIDAARFKRPVERGIWKYKAVGSVDGKVALEAELMCTIRSAVDASQAAGQ